MAIAYKSAGTGVATATSGAALNPTCPATVDANDILIAHVTYELLVTAPVTPSGWTELYGPTNLGTGATPTARSWVFGRIADGSEDGAAVSFGTPAVTSGRYGRIYSFSGYTSGAIDEICVGFDGLPSEGSIPLPPTRTYAAGGLAVALLVQDDNNAFAAAGAVTGGTWAEPVAEFVTTLGLQGGVVGIQTSTPTGDPGQIRGGTANATADEGSSIGFSIHAAPPTGLHLVSTATFTYYSITGTPRDTSEVLHWLTGDLIVAVGVAGDESAVLDAPTATGLSFTQDAFTSNPTGNFCDVWIWSDVAAGAGSDNLTGVRSSGGSTFGYAASVWRNHDGVGATATDTSATQTVSLTRGGADSAVMEGDGDWSGSAAAATFSPAEGVQLYSQGDGSALGSHVGVWEAQGAAGSTSYGVSSASTGSFAKAAIEILALVGGTTFPVTQTDSAGLTDSSLLDRALVYTDSVGLTDARLLTRSLVVTDSAGLTDAAALTRGLVYTDSAGLTDTSTVQATKLVTQTDSAGLTDNAVLARSLVYTDSTGLVDAALLTRSLVYTDSAGLTDTSTVQASKLITQTDSAGLTDTSSLARTLVYTDSAGLTDAALLARSLVYTDSIGLTDTSTVQSAKLVTQTDSAGLTDAGLSLDVEQDFTDTIGLTDGVTFAAAPIFTDSIGLTDAALLTRTLVYTDSAGLTDTSTVQATKLVAQTDSVGLTDAALLTRSLVVTDSVGLTDTSSLARSLVYTDSIGLTDTQAISAGRLLEFTDSAGLTDSQVFSQTKAHTDSAGLTDTTVFVVSKVLTDSVGLTDAALVVGQRDVVATDSVGLTDSRLILRSLGVTDSAGLTDSTSFATSWRFTDSAGLTDAASVDLLVPVVFGRGMARQGSATTGMARQGSAAKGMASSALVGSGQAGRG